jgi:hypothetical protein
MNPSERTVLELIFHDGINNGSLGSVFSLELLPPCDDYRESVGLFVDIDDQFTFRVPVTLNCQDFTVGLEQSVRIRLGDIMAWRMQPQEDMAHHLPVYMVRIVLIALRRMYKDSVTPEEFDTFDRILQEVCGDGALV